MYGRAEPIRMLLNHAGIEFEDVRVDYNDWQEIKKQSDFRDFFEFGQMPVLERNGKFYAQSYAILRMLGKEFGYYPNDPEDMWFVDSTIMAEHDLLEAFWDVTYVFKTDPEHR